eukprot:5101691-Pyramimonas_sp.AAC.1
MLRPWTRARAGRPCGWPCGCSRDLCVGVAAPKERAQTLRVARWTLPSTREGGAKTEYFQLGQCKGGRDQGSLVIQAWQMTGSAFEEREASWAFWRKL